MKSEIENVLDLKNMFLSHLELANNILYQEKISKNNISFFSRQKEWCEMLSNDLNIIYNKLKIESLENRIFRHLGHVESESTYNKIIIALQNRRDHFLEKKRQKELRLLAKDQEKLREKKKRGIYKKKVTHD